jgi:hypothetical protein
MLCDGSSKFLWRFLCQSHRYVWWVALSTDGLRQSSATACLQYDRAFFIDLHIFPSLSLSLSILFCFFMRLLCTCSWSRSWSWSKPCLAKGRNIVWTDDDHRETRCFQK